MFEIKGKTALGSQKKIVGEIEALKAPFSFRDLQESLQGKILVCPGKLTKDVMEKARALGVLGLVCQEIDAEKIEAIKRELKTSWAPFQFGFLVVDEDLDQHLPKIKGKKATLEVEKKRLVVET